MRIGIVLVSSLAMLSGGCSNKHWDPADYPVTSGETIYSIAWKYELDPIELARWNNLSSPYRIYPGQRLQMRPDDGSTRSQQRSTRSRRAAGPTPDSVTVRQGDSLYKIAQRHGLDAMQLASINSLSSPYTIYPGETLKLKAGKAANKPQSAPTTPKPTNQLTTNKISWQWPVQGKLIARFKSNDSTRKGIDISADEGKAIRAAASGKVVYSGNGLISYGNLLIIKHDRTYLSAYAHNRKLLVKEGQVIAAGQKIAELGQTGAESPRMHFEIRKNGKPVDPLRYLPRG